MKLEGSPPPAPKAGARPKRAAISGPKSVSGEVKSLDEHQPVHSPSEALTPWHHSTQAKTGPNTLPMARSDSQIPPEMKCVSKSQQNSSITASHEVT